MKTVFLTIAILIIGLSGQAQKAYGADSYTAQLIKNGIIEEPFFVDSPVTLLLMAKEFFIHFDSDHKLQSDIASKKTIDKNNLVYTGYPDEDNIGKVEISIQKTSDRVRVTITCNLFNIRFETTDKDIL